MLRRLLFRLRMAWYKLYFWLEDFLPVTCPVCGQTVQARNMRQAKHTVAGWVDICLTCFNELYGHDQTPGV